MGRPHRFLIVLAVLVFASCSGGGAPVAPSSFVLPIRMVEEDPIIEVRVNGMSIDVLFDLGISGGLALFPSQLDRIEEKSQVDMSVGGTSMLGPTGGGRPIYEVELVEVGKLKIENARIGEDYHDDDFQEQSAAQNDAYGYFGREFLLDYKVIVDYAQSNLTIIPPDAPSEQQSACSGAKLSLIQGQDWGLVSNVETDIGEIVVVWDTGSPANVVSKKRTDMNDLRFETEDRQSFEQFRINGHDFGPQNFEVWDFGEYGPPFDGFIGYDFFADHVVCIDFPNKLIFVQQ